MKNENYYVEELNNQKGFIWKTHARENVTERREGSRSNEPERCMSAITFSPCYYFFSSMIFPDKSFFAIYM